MTNLQRLHDEQGQSAWLDNLTRAYLRDGTLGRLVADGIRGVTANPTIFARAIEGSDAYDEQFATRIAQGRLSAAQADWGRMGSPGSSTQTALQILLPDPSLDSQQTHHRR